MLTKFREVFRPFEYPEIEEFWKKQQQAHWLHFEVPMASDINDWKSKLSENEKYLIGSVLKGFTQIEILVGEYWANKVPKWFPKPEINCLGQTFASFENIHAFAYSYLNTSLGLEDFDAFLYEPTAKAKLDNLINTPSNKIEDIALSLAVYSVLTEGVGLFSSFAILLSFSMRNLLKGVGQIVTWSQKDECLHSDAGTWLFNQLCKENPELKSKELITKIHDAAKIIIDLEHNFIDMCFEKGDLPNLSKNDLKNYIIYRTNTKLSDIKISKIKRKVDLTAIQRLQWFDVLLAAKEHQDFFAQRVTAYSKGTINWDNMWEFE